MVLFPEGGFLHKRREVSQRYAEKHNLPQLKHVSLPRVGALKAIFSVLPPHDQPANNNSPDMSEPNVTKPTSTEKITSADTQIGNGVTEELLSCMFILGLQCG